MLWNQNLPYTLIIYGEVDLCRIWLEKLIAIYEQHDFRSRPSLLQGLGIGLLNATHSLYNSAGLSNLVVRLMRAMHCTFDEIETTSEAYYKVICIDFLDYYSTR